MVCFIDLDRFKIINDTAGHAAGDALLREIGIDYAQGYAIHRPAPLAEVLSTFLNRRPHLAMVPSPSVKSE